MIHNKSHNTTDGRLETGLARWTKRFEFAGRTWSLVKRADAESSPYWLDAYVAKKRITRSLQTNVCKVAQERAVTKYLRPAIAGRWAEIEDNKARGTVTATIGQVIEKYQPCNLLRAGERARRENVNCLRRIVRAGLGLEDGAAVDEQPVSVLTKALVRAYQTARLADVGEDKLARDRQAVTANSTLTQARSLFGKRVQALELYQGLELGDLSGFMHAQELEELKRDHYELPPSEDLARILADLEVLANDKPELWLVAVLAMQSGLRRSELVAARWRWLEVDTIRVRFEADFVPKGKKERAVPVDRVVLDQVRKLAFAQGWALADTDYVLPHAKRSTRLHLFRQLGKWLKARGWTRRQKAHELRKVYASVLTASAGAYAAKVALGHQDIRTTERYAARPVIASVDVAKALQALTAPASPPAPGAPSEPVLTVVEHQPKAVNE